MRKVKCDEGRPVCRSCRLRRAECVYVFVRSSHDGSPSASALPSKTSSDQGSASPCSGAHVIITSEPQFRPASFGLEEMRLLWFYTIETCQSFSVKLPNRESFESVFQGEIESVLRGTTVRLAFENPFLMDSLLALTSLHLQSLNQDYDVRKAVSYRVRSYEGYRKAIEEARPETFGAIVANSLFLTALSSQAFRDPAAQDLYIVDWILVWKGIGLILNMTGFCEELKEDLRLLFYRPPLNLAEAHKAIPGYMLPLVSSITPADQEFRCIEAYYGALKCLGSLYLHLREGCGPVMRLRICVWLTFLNEDFVELCRLYRPRALIILAHYAVFLKIISRSWWIRGVADRTVRDICNTLDHEWLRYMETPILALDVTDPFGIVKLLLNSNT